MLLQKVLSILLLLIITCGATERPAATSSPPNLVCEDNVTGYFPFPPPDNCIQYYYCSRGVHRFNYTCSPGLFFTPGDNQCRAEVPRGCGHLTTERPATTASPPVIVCEENVTGYFPFPPPENCIRYYYCSRGVHRFNYTCSPGLFFTPGDNQCRAEVPRGCGHLTTERPATTASPPVLVCEENVTGYFPFPPPDNCTQYYYCSRGVHRFNYTCSPGLFFTPGDNQCRAEVPRGCGHLTTERPATTASPPVLVCEENVTGYFPFPPPDNCIQYYYCSRGVHRFNYTCSPGLFFTPGDNQCRAEVPRGCGHLTTERPATTASTPVIVCEENVTGYFQFPPPDNCIRYYYCSRGVHRFNYTCSPGLIFTPGDNQCRAEVPPGCEYLTTESPATTASPPDPLCEENFTGYLPFPPPDNCIRYYYCSRGVHRFNYTCSPGLFFTPGDNQCRAEVPRGCENLVK